jgi:hypothetical protein
MYGFLQVDCSGVRGRAQVQKVALWTIDLRHSSYYVLLCICSLGCLQFDN